MLQGAERLVDEMREAGNRSMRQGDHYDALWKYNHAIILCREQEVSPPKTAIVNCNCAQACLKLKHYIQAFKTATTAIKTDPKSSIIHKVYTCT